jgi:hypothetical protein
MKIRTIILLIIALWLWVAQSQAYVQKIHNEDQLFRTINKRSIAIVFFYYEDKETRKDPALKRSISSTLSYLERMSRLPWYEDGDCIFASVNSANEELCALMHSLGIKQAPCYVLFYNSAPVRGTQGQIVLLQGYVPRNILESFINRYAGGTIEDNVHERAEQRRIEREEARIRYQYYAPYFYCGYPYWGSCWGGYPYGGCYGPRFGCGVSFGFGCGCGY